MPSVTTDVIILSWAIIVFFPDGSARDIDYWV